MKTRYWYFKPGESKPIKSPYAPYYCDNLYPEGTQCIDTVRKKAHELELFYNGQTPMFCELVGYHQLHPQVRAFALLADLQL